MPRINYFLYGDEHVSAVVGNLKHKTYIMMNIYYFKHLLLQSKRQVTVLVVTSTPRQMGLIHK